jgi:hypothetical protein
MTCVDKQLVDDFCKMIDYENVIHERYKPITEKTKKLSVEYSFLLGGNVRKRIEEMGYSPGVKTGKEFFPSRFYNKEWFFPFLRGFIDGDGTIRVGQRGDLLLSVVNASFELLADIHLYLLDNEVVKGGSLSKVKITKKNKRKTTIYSLGFGHKDSISICDRMYEDPTIMLERKCGMYLAGKEFILSVVPYEEYTPCQAFGCEKEAKIRGYCKQHYDEKYRRWYNASHRNELNEKNKKWQLINRDFYLARRRRWYLKNAEKERQRSKAWKDANPEKVKLMKDNYRENNRDKVNEYKRSYREEHSEKIREQEKASYLRNKQQKNRHSREYYQKNREKVLAQAKEYRDRPEVKERKVQYCKDYENKNKEKQQEYRRQYYYRKKAERESLQD